MKLKLAALWIALQVVFFGAWAISENARFDKDAGVSILVETVPYDPRDLLRGQYLNLAYKFSTPSRYGAAVPEVEDGREIWVVLAPEGRFHQPRRVEFDPPQGLTSGEVAVRGRFERSRIIFGIEQYFVPEGSPTPDNADITVRLRIGNDGSPRIEQVYVRDKPWP